MDELTTFREAFKSLTGDQPFPWQENMYLEWFSRGKFPHSCNLPTGSGKTSVVAIWLCALARAPEKTPRRLVYVVNRRTVVDQTTAEAERLRDALNNPALAEVRNALMSLCALPLPTPDAPPLAISTLRGQFADNGEWCTDPSRPAIIIGTVDMIGSGLLFSRYTRGFKTRPLHAGFLGQEALLVHDEAHLEPAFQKLLESIVAAQNASNDLRKLRVIELTATSRAANTNSTPPFTLTAADQENKIVKERLNAIKWLSLVAVTKVENDKDKANDGTVRDKILELALNKKDSNRAILVFVRSVEAATKIKDELAKRCEVASLTGTMRGKERDELVTRNPVFQRFLSEKDCAPGIEATPGTVFLVATSAGEVGVNISADDLVCDLSTYESMAQRFGRVNRYGKRKDNDASEITVVYRTNLQASYDEGLEKANSAKKDPEKKVAAYEKKNQSVLCVIKTLVLLEKLDRSASPAALEGLPALERIAAFSPPPELRIATEIQFDAWALTSIREPIAARPPVAPYLHGQAEWQPPETHVAWREELDVLGTAELRDAYPPADLLEDFPLKPHELLRDTSERVFDQIADLLRKRQDNGAPLPHAWLVGEDGNVMVLPLTRLVSDDGADAEEEEQNEEEGGNDGADKKAEKARKIRAIAALADATLILPASLGGIDKNGMLTANATHGAEGKADVADIVAKDAADKILAQRCRVWNNTPDVPAALATAGFRLIRTIDKCLNKEDADGSEETRLRYWLWLEAKASAAAGAGIGSPAETLATHTDAVAANAAAIAAKCFPDKSALAVDEPDLRRCLIVAAHLHDLGKNRAQWQRNLGNLAYDSAKPETILAKSASGMRVRNVAEHYRHEFGSIKDGNREVDFAVLSDTERDIVLHIVAAHHGRARPHFPSDEIFDYTSDSLEELASLATEIPRRFARLQERFGRWGLAWLESILRAADYAASAGIVAPREAAAKAAGQRVQGAGFRAPMKSLGEKIVPTVTIVVDPANPGHYFACCGLFELAARVAANGNNAKPALAWFEQNSATCQWHFHLANTPPLAKLLKEITAAEIAALNPEDRAKSALEIRLSNGNTNLRLDWWRHEGGPIGKLKPWAGNTSVRDIADDMRQTINGELATSTTISTEYILSSTSTANNGEPFYFDANRAVNARAQDVGFSIDKLKKGGLRISTNAAPAVELLALIGLQRTRPSLALSERGREREYDYHFWREPLPVALLAATVTGLLPDTTTGFRFSNPSRAKDYRAFAPAKAFHNLVQHS
jgi:CRISPR-associated endonuclease/helicase Cas3